MTFEYWFRIAVALETIVFPGDSYQIALNGVVPALGRHCQYCYQIVTNSHVLLCDVRRVRDEARVAGFDLLGLSSHSLCHESIQVRIDRTVLSGNYVPRRNILPGGSANGLAKNAGSKRFL